MEKATATENLPNGSVVQIIGQTCNTITTNEQFQRQSTAIFNVDKDYKKGDQVSFEPLVRSAFVDQEVSNIKKLLLIEPKTTSKYKKSIRSLISRKANNLQGA